MELSGDTPRLGDKVVECREVGFHYPGGPPVLAGVDLVLGRRERLGIVGANGTGKSTLVDLLAGRRPPTSGTVETGPTVVVGYYDQQGVELDLTARVQELVAGPSRTPGSLADVALMKRFWFAGELPYARVGTLSGGERRRLQLLLVLVGRPNVLFLDEPTNDLDLDTLRILEEFLEEWPGALVVVSHDRTFLERTTERLVAVEADGTVAGVPGGLEAWVARAADTGPRPAGPPAAPAAATPPPSARPPNPAPATGGGEGAGPLGRRLRDAEKEMARLQRRRDAVTRSLTGEVGHQEMTRLGAELAEAQRDLDQAEERWLSLAEEAERRG
jgi:ATP-binding cassette subfamily F protein uup